MAISSRLIADWQMRTDSPLVFFFFLLSPHLSANEVVQEWNIFVEDHLKIINNSKLNILRSVTILRLCHLSASQLCHLQNCLQFDLLLKFDE